VVKSALIQLATIEIEYQFSINTLRRKMAQKAVTLFKRFYI